MEIGWNKNWNKSIRTWFFLCRITGRKGEICFAGRIFDGDGERIFRFCSWLFDWLSWLIKSKSGRRSKFSFSSTIIDDEQVAIGPLVVLIVSFWYGDERTLTRTLCIELFKTIQRIIDRIYSIQMWIYLSILVERIDL